DHILLEGAWTSQGEETAPSSSAPTLNPLPQRCFKCDKIFYKPPIEACKPMKNPNLPHNLRCWPILDGLHLSLIYIDSMGANHKTKEGNFFCTKNELIFPPNFYVLDMEDETLGKGSTLILG
ncbi:hypothetical protein CR513_39571, partial [Mucuna pruriens]